MGIRQDLSSSILLCSEENNSILFLEDGEGEQIDNFYFNFVSSFPVQTNECIKLLIERESQHLPNQRYIKRLKNGSFEASFRRDAIHWISKVVFLSPFLFFSKLIMIWQLLCNTLFLYCFYFLADHFSLNYIYQVHSHFNFGPQTFYLSINYFDRFLSAYELPVRLLSLKIHSLIYFEIYFPHK